MPSFQTNQPQYNLKPITENMDPFGFRKKMLLKPVSRKWGYQTNFNNNSNLLTIQTNFNIMINGKSNTFIYNGLLVIQQNQKQQNAPKNIKSNQLTNSNSKISQNKQKNIRQCKITQDNKKFQQSFSHQIIPNTKMYENLKQQQEVLVNQFENVLQINNINSNLPNFIPSKANKSNVQQEIQKILGRQQSQIIQRTLQKLLSKQILKDETKITISSQILTVCLSLIKQYHHDNLQKLFGNPFIAINSINKSILQYIKSKYPRNKAISVPMGLDKQFQKINYLQVHQFDTLVNAKFSFTNPHAGRIQILDKTKKFINCILKETDNHYQNFNRLLNFKIFDIKSKQKMEQTNRSNQGAPNRFQDLSKTNHVKISRKLPQTTQRYYQFGTDRMEIPSPQLFRVMLKWIDGMQQLISNPSSLISTRFGLKFIKKHHQPTDNKNSANIIFDQIQSRRFEDLKIDIIQKISEIKQKQYDIKIKQLLDKLNQFNNNLVKTLTVRSPKVKFIKQQLAQTLKFAKFNSLFLEWLIIEKFLIIVQTLSQLSAYFQTKIYKKLDFINFDVYDLMRACFSGKKDEIIQVFKNLKTLQTNNDISIIRIKNRFQTPLNDVLINFKMNSSFIICQLQLILADVLQQGEQKLKYIEDLNHIIYELERSPYGSMSEMAMIISHFDPTIIYQAKINFNNDWFTDQICKYSSGSNKEHSFIQIKIQTTPFVCAWCVKFYGRLDNFFQYHKCIKCNLQKCKACVFQQNPTEQKRAYYKHFAMSFLGISNDTSQFSQLKDQSFIDNFFMRQESNFFSEYYIKVRDYINVDKGVKINSLQKLMHQYQKQYGLKATQPFYCLLLRFFNGSSQLIALKYQNYKIKICLQIDEDQKNEQILRKNAQNQNKIKLQKHDAIFFLKKKVYLNQRQTDGSYIDKMSLTQIKNIVYITNSQKKVHISNKKKYRVTCLIHKKEKFLLQIIKQQNIKLKGTESLQDTQQSAQHLQQINRVLNKTIERCELYKIERTNFDLQSLDINQIHLKNRFSLHEGAKKDKKSPSWTKQTLVVNLSQNKIKNPSYIIQIFFNVKQLYLAKNLITGMEFIKQLNSLTILDLEENKIKQIPQIINEKMNNLTVLKVSHNNIQKYPVFNLPQLQQLYLNMNKIQNFDNLFQSNLPALYILDISKNTMSGNNEIHWKNFSKFTKLKKLQAKKINLSIQQNENKNYFSIQWLPKIQFIELSHNKLTALNQLSSRKLRQLKLVSCNIKKINNIFSNKLINLQLLQLQNNQISQFPQNLELAQLKILRLSSNKIKKLQNIRSSYLPKLQILELQSNGMKNVDDLQSVQFNCLKQLSLDHNMLQTLPTFKWPSLQILNLDFNKLKDINSLSKSMLPSLKFLLIKCNNLKSLPYLNLPELLQLNPFDNQLLDLQQFSKSNIPKMIKLSLYKNKLKQIPSSYDFPNITTMLLFNNHLTNIDGLSASKLDSLKLISINSNKVVKLPILKLNCLQIFNAYKNHLTTIRQINEWETPKLRVIDVRLNSIQQLVALKQSSIQVLDVSNNNIEDLTDFSTNSELPLLRRFIANSNKKLAKIGGDFRGCPRIQQIIINHCALQNFDELSIAQNSHNNVLKLQYLKKISLQNNQITHLPPPDTLNHLQNLQQFLIRSNKITLLNYKLANLKNLKVLYMSSNIISQIDSQYFEDQCNLVQVSFTRNPLKKLNFPQTLNLKSLTLNFCELTDEMLKGLQLPKLKQLFLKKNQLETLNFLTISGAFTSLKKLYLQQNKVKKFPQFNLPEVSQIFLLFNPIQDINQLLVCTIPMIKLLYLRKIKKKNINKSPKKQNNGRNSQTKQKTNDLEAQNIFRQILQIQNNQRKMVQSDSQQQENQISNKSDGDSQSRQQFLMETILNQKSKQVTAKQEQIIKVIAQFKKMNPNVFVKY